MTSLVDRAELSESPEWRRRVRQAMTTVAIAVGAEAATTPNHAARRVLSAQVLANPDGWARTLSYGAAQDPGVGAEDTSDPQLSDVALHGVIAGLWDAYTAPEVTSA